MTESAETIALIDAARAGDRGSLEALLRLHRPRLLDRIRLLMGDQARRIADSADFAQVVLVDVTAGLGSFESRGSGSFLRWLTQIARNRIRDAVRRRREESIDTFVMGSLTGGDGPQTRAQINELREQVADALQQLSEDHRRVVELRQLDGLSFAAVGQQMGRSENAVQLLFARALVELGSRLGPLRKT